MAFPINALSVEQAQNRAIQSNRIPSFGSATANETFVSSLIESSNDANRGVTLPSTIAAVSSSALTALSNFWKFFNFNLSNVRDQNPSSI